MFHLMSKLSCHLRFGSRSALTACLVAVTLAAVSQPGDAHAAKLKEWYDQKPKKALLAFSMRDRNYKMQMLREMKINRQGYVIQLSRFAAGSLSYPVATFVIQDLGYTNAMFSQNAGDDMRPGTSLKQWDKDVSGLGESGNTKNRYGRVDYQFYRSSKQGNCLYVRQYGGNSSGDVRGGGTALGSILIHGFYCTGSEKAVAQSALHDFSESYTVNMN